jgi:hypothetical protein
VLEPRAHTLVFLIAVDTTSSRASNPARDRLIAREHDRLLARADGIQPAAAEHDQRSHAARLADDTRPRLNIQRRAVVDEHRPAQHVVVAVRPRLVPVDASGDDDDGLVDARHRDRRGLIGDDVRGLCDGQQRHERQPTQSL